MLCVSCIFVADGGKLGLLGEDLLEVEPLVCRVRVMVMRACPGVDLSKPEWLFGLFNQVFGAGSAAELLEQHYAFPIHQTQILAAQHEL